MSQKMGPQVDLLRCHLKLHIFKGQYSRSEVKLGHQNTNNTRELVFELWLQKKAALQPPPSCSASSGWDLRGLVSCGTT